MVENELTDALRELITEAVKDFRLPVKNGNPRPPDVMDFAPPPKRSGDKDDFPFIIVRADNGEIDLEQTDFEVFIIIGCYSDKRDSNRHCLNVMSRIRNALTMLECHTLAGKFILQFPIQWELFAEQPEPYSQLNIKTKWSYCTPQAPFETGGY